MEFEEPPLDEEKELEPPRLYIHKSIGAAGGDDKFQMVMKYVQNQEANTCDAIVSESLKVGAPEKSAQKMKI